MPGSGISAENKSLFVQAGFKAIHASASELITEASPSSQVTFEAPRQLSQRRQISSERLKNLLGPS
jgi:copper homeostasis protein CutC